MPPKEIAMPLRPARLRSCWMLLVILATLGLRGLSGVCLRSAVAAETESATAVEFPSELVNFSPAQENPVFAAEGPGHWDVKIRERGWIMREGETYHLWFTGYDGTREGIRQLGYATSPDGLHWTRHPGNPLVRGHWVEDVMVVKQDETYYMFAEGLHDHAQLLTSKDRVNWERQGTLDIRTTDGQPLSPGPFGTPTAWLEKGSWHLFYERQDAGVWLATSKDLKIWTNVQDEPVLRPGPEAYDRNMIAMNQVVKHEGAYFAYYHGSGSATAPRTWNTNVARSTDLVHWKKYPGNPIVANNKSSGIVVFDGRQNRLYTMHEQMDVYFPRGK
jgi:beta-1,2-mannobiose phosphorylase / 1,2-beta-oligomannan phosphorylase